MSEKLSNNLNFPIDMKEPGQTEGDAVRKSPASGREVEQSRYRQLFENMGKGAIVCDTPDEGYTFIVRDINPTAVSMLSAPAGDLTGCPIQDLFADRNPGTLLAVFHRVYSTKRKERYICNIVDISGRNVLREILVFALANRQLMVIVGDSSPLELERLLRRGKDEWEKTFDALSDIVTIQDPDMRIIRANRAAYEMFGERLGAFIGSRCYEVFQNYSAPCPGCPVVEVNIDRCANTDLIYNEKLQRTFDVRSSQICDDDGSLKWIVHIARDVTEDLARESQRNLLSAAIEQASESVIITNRDGVLQYVNPAFSSTSGFSRKEAVGRTPALLRSGLHDKRFYKDMWDQLLAGKVWRGTLINRNSSGELFKEDATISPIFGASGEITNFIALKRDLTREDSLERQLQHAMKMEAIGTLAGGIAHDFNNILSAIIGYGYIAKGKLEGNSPILGDLDQILSGADRAADLVKQILTFARQEKEEQQLQSVNVQYIIKEVLKLLRSSLPTTIELKPNIDNSCRPIMGDPGQIHQLLMNLCTNAKYAISHDYGILTIGLRQCESGELRDFEGLKNIEPGEYLHLSVTDTGCGMEQEVIERVFDPFFTTHAKEHGTGLGLAVVHGIVKKHRGEIVVDSKPGQGTTFHAVFPVAEQEVQVPERTENVDFHGDERVMVVDDETSIGTVINRILSNLGYRVTNYSDSLEAVKQFRENPNCCDLVITDMTMPNMKGSELAREMLALRPDLPIIMLTGYSEEIDKEKAMQIGIREFLLKPVRMAQLSCALREVLASGQNSHN